MLKDEQEVHDHHHQNSFPLSSDGGENSDAGRKSSFEGSCEFGNGPVPSNHSEEMTDAGVFSGSKWVYERDEKRSDPGHSTGTNKHGYNHGKDKINKHTAVLQTQRLQLEGDHIVRNTRKRVQKAGVGHPTISKKYLLPPRISSPMNELPKPKNGKDEREHRVSKHPQPPNQVRHSVSKSC